MEAKHTQGLLQVNHSNPDQVCDCDGEQRGCAPVAFMQGVSGSERRANARRLVACWNACIDLSTEQIEQINGLMPARLAYQIMQRDREILLTTLQDIATYSDPYGLRAKAALEKIGAAS